jgi:hypothetical protein
MKKDFDQSKLIDALLADESWETCSGRLHHSALTTLRTARKSRARRMAVAQGVALVALFGVIAWRFAGPERGWRSRSNSELVNISPPSSNVPQSERATVGPAPGVPYITEDQMLAMLPEGSCVLAEVNGEKQLIVLDDSAARNGFAASQTQ